MPTKTRKSIGTYELGYFKIEIYVLPASIGGTLCFLPRAEDSILPNIDIGINYDKFWDVQNVLLHEALEYYLAIKGYRYGKTNEICSGSDRYFFWINHQQFSDACESVAELIETVRPALYKEWSSRNKTKTKKKET